MLFPSDVLTKILYAILITPMHGTCHAYLINLYLITLISFGEEFKYEVLHCAIFFNSLQLPLF